MNLLLDTADITLLHDPQHDWLFVQWQGRQPQQSILAACNLILTHVRATGCAKILNDSTSDEDGWGKLIAWLSTRYFQQLADNGIRAVAWVLPTNLRARADVQKLVAAIAQPLTDVFADTEAAYAWLSKV